MSSMYLTDQMNIAPPSTVVVFFFLKSNLGKAQTRVIIMEIFLFHLLIF